MSTTKNEHNHILSPEWLKKNPLPEDAERRVKGHPQLGWVASDMRMATLFDSQIEKNEYRTQRTDLPPEAYVTPPTDTTGSGREGETPETNAVEATRIALGQPRTPAYGDMMACSKRIERQRDAALAQVEALRRDGEQLRKERNSLKMSLEILRKNRDEWKRSWGQVVRERDALRAAIDSAQRQEAE